MDEVMPVRSDSGSRPALLGLIEEARTVFAAIADLVTENENLQGLVASLRRERDELRDRCAQLSRECQREVELRSQIQEESAALFAEVKGLVANAKQKFSALQGHGLISSGQ